MIFGAEELEMRAEAYGAKINNKVGELVDLRSLLPCDNDSFKAIRRIIANAVGAMTSVKNI